jgi:hypothetical protein
MIAHHTPLCHFLDGHLTVFSVEGLLGAGRVDVAAVARAEAAVHFTRHVDPLAADDFQPRKNGQVPETTASFSVGVDGRVNGDINGDIKSGVEDGVGGGVEGDIDGKGSSTSSTATMHLPPDIIDLLNFHLLHTHGAAGRYEPLSVLRDACRLLKQVRTCGVNALLPIGSFARTYTAPACSNRTEGMQPTRTSTSSNTSATTGATTTTTAHPPTPTDSDPSDIPGDSVLRAFHLALRRRRLHLALGETPLQGCGDPPIRLALAPRRAPALQGTLCEPWIDRGVIFILDRLLHPSMRALEWGAGASSRWLLQRVGGLVSVEHDGAFFGALKEAAQGWPPILTVRRRLVVV